MTERPNSYVGISGVVRYRNVQPSGLVVTEPQQIFLEGYAENAGLFETDRLLLLGVKATHKTQFEDIENKYGRDWYPVGAEGLRDALSYKRKHPRTLGVAQMYLERERVHDAEYRNFFLARTAFRAGKWIEAIQLDMLPWHEDESLFETLAYTKDELDLATFLQCHGEAMETLGPKGAVQMLGRYAELLDYVLFDSSHGTGKRMDTAKLDEFLEEAYASDDLGHVGFAVAGGLNAENVREDLPRLIEKYPDLSWDAEGQLHSLNNAGKRPLYMDDVKEYLQASVDTING